MSMYCRGASLYHCWHATETFSMRGPPQRQEVCCNCNERRWVEAIVTSSPPKHGPYMPHKKREYA